MTTGRAVLIFFSLLPLLLNGSQAQASDCFCREGENDFIYDTKLAQDEPWMTEYPWSVISTSPITDLRSPNEDEIVGCHVMIELVDETMPESDLREELQQIFYGHWMSIEEFEKMILESRCLPALS